MSDVKHPIYDDIMTDHNPTPSQSRKGHQHHKEKNEKTGDKADWMSIQSEQKKETKKDDGDGREVSNYSGWRETQWQFENMLHGLLNFASLKCMEWISLYDKLDYAIENWKNDGDIERWLNRWNHISTILPS